MATNVLNAFVANPPIDGGVYYRAPLGTALPTDATTALDAAFKDHGAIGDDGFSINQKRDSKKINQFGGKVFIALQEKFEETIELEFLEDDNLDVVRTVFGDEMVTVTPGTETEGQKVKIYHSARPLPISSHVLNAVYQGKKKRFVIARGQVTEVAEVKSVHSDATRYKITIDTYDSGKAEDKDSNVIEYREGVPAPMSPVQGG